MFAQEKCWKEIPQEEEEEEEDTGGRRRRRNYPESLKRILQKNTH